MESLFDLWSKRNPQWEKRYEESVIKVFTDYGRGTTSYQAARAKIFGAGYELFIIAFFIGLYFDQTKPLIEDKAKIKSFGQPIQYWGNQENRLGRKSYGEIRQFLFAALVAKKPILTLLLWIKAKLQLEKLLASLLTRWSNTPILVSLTYTKRWRKTLITSLKRQHSLSCSCLS